MAISRRRGARAGPVNASSIVVPERFCDMSSYYESNGPLTPSAFRAYVDDLKCWLEATYGVPLKASGDLVFRVIGEIEMVPSMWLDYAANEGIGYRNYESGRPEPVEVPENEPIVEVVPALSTNPTYDELMAHIRGQGVGK